MDPILIAILGLLGMFILIAAHAPVGAAMGIAGVLTFAAIAGVGPGAATLGVEAIAAITSLDFAIIPFFILMGGFAVAGGLSNDLYALANAFWAIGAAGWRWRRLAFARFSGPFAARRLRPSRP